MVFIYSAVRYRPKGPASNIMVKSCKTFSINMTETVEKKLFVLPLSVYLSNNFQVKTNLLEKPVPGAAAGSEIQILGKPG